MGTYFTKVFRKKTLCREKCLLQSNTTILVPQLKRCAINSPQVTKKLKLEFSTSPEQVLTSAAGTLLDDGYIMSLKRI